MSVETKMKAVQWLHLPDCQTARLTTKYCYHTDGSQAEKLPVGAGSILASQEPASTGVSFTVNIVMKGKFQGLRSGSIDLIQKHFYKDNFSSGLPT